MDNKLFIIALLLLIINVECQRAPLKMNKKGKFNVLQFTDTHFGQQRENLLNMGLMTNMLSRFRPDFTVISGDMVSGYNWDGTQGWYKKQWQQWTLPFRLTRSKYAVCLGNHDSQADLNRTEIMQLDATSTLSYSQVGPLNITHSSNYWIPIYSHLIKGQVAAIMWFLDSGDEGCEIGNPYSWGCVERDQVAWFESENQKIKELYGDDVLTIAFIHIPLPEFVTVYDTQPINGNRAEGVSCPLINTGLFQVLVKHQVRAVFSGHDHNNDYHGNLLGVDLVYGRQTGFGGYGPPISMKRGGRLLTFKEQIDPYGNYVVTFNHVIATSDGKKTNQGAATLRDDKAVECPYHYDIHYKIPITNFSN